MEIKEALEILTERTLPCMATVFWKGSKGHPEKLEQIEALQAIIPHLKTLQKVMEMGGVKKKEFILNENDGDDININYQGYVRGFNKALDLKDAELAGKLEGLEEVIKTWAKTNGDLFNLINKIQELILGIKEG